MIKIVTYIYSDDSSTDAELFKPNLHVHILS